MSSAPPGTLQRRAPAFGAANPLGAGGGGFGDPLQRAPERVAQDVWNGKITAAYAAREHGVVVDAASGVLDRAATERLRSTVSAKP